MQQEQSLGNIHSNSGFPQKTRKISKSLNYHLKELDKEQTKSNVSRRKEIIKIREEINIKKIIVKKKDRASLVAQWLRVCLLMQGTRVRALVWEDPTCRGATWPVSHNC